MLKSLINAQHLQGRRMIENKNLSKWVLEQKFDFAYTEAFNFYMLGLFKVWKIPYGIGTATAMFDLHYSIFGIAAAPSYQPMQMLAYSDKMSYKERVINLGTFMFCTYFYQLIREEMSSEIYFNSIYGEDAFDYRREAAASSFIFANSHPFLEIPFPKSAKMIEVGGIGIKKPKELNEYWLGILHQRENTVLISFGTVCKSHRMPAIMKNSIIETIRKRTEINFIWKYETPEDGLIPKLDNLILSKWVPQNDLLNHEKLSMFVTHGGMNSITELAFRGKRTLAIGIFGDQLKNVELVTRTKIGLVMNKNDLKDAQKFENNVMTVLHMEAGHEVVVLVVDMDLDINDQESSKARIHEVRGNPEAIRLMTESPVKHQMWNISDDPTIQFEMFNSFFDAQELTRNTLMNDKELTDFVLNEKFDFAYTEIFNAYMIAMFKAWKMPAFAVGVATCLNDGHYSIFGLPFAPSHMPALMSSFTDKMNYIERVKNVGTFLFSKGFFWYCREKLFGVEGINAIYGKDFFNAERDLSDASFFFINSHPFLEVPTPKTPKMIEIGGIGVAKPQELSKEWLDILNRKKNTILISFGSIAKSSMMPASMKKSIVDAIKSLPEVTFIFKYETPEDGLIPKLDNLILSKWVPQNDLLNHEKLSMFITHGGMNSITELAAGGKRALIIPVFGDQLHNAALVERANIGIVMDKNDLFKSHIFKQNILKVLNNAEFKETGAKLSKMIKNRPISSKELLVKHFTFACEFKKLPMLDLESKNQSFIVYYLLDIIIPFFLFISTLFFGSIYVIKKLCCNFYSKFISSTKLKVE
uniref:Glucuronosyltransferase n=1 Tax=Rhabditophanes sp. KR3021 TaxID=114890 RepID=A0AC35TXE9_9BILA